MSFIIYYFIFLACHTFFHFICFAKQNKKTFRHNCTTTLHSLHCFRQSPSAYKYTLTYTLPGNLHLSTNNKLHLKINILASTIQFITSGSSRYSRQVIENVITLSNKQLGIDARTPILDSRLVARVLVNHRNFRSSWSLAHVVEIEKGKIFICFTVF